MKLAIVCQRYRPSERAGRFIAHSLPALERAGVEVTLIAREAEGWGARRMLRVDPFHLGRAWSDRSFAQAARQAWLREGFDLVQSHEPIPGCHVYRASSDDASLKEVVEHARLRAVLCDSKRRREAIRRAFRVAPEKLHVIYGGVDLAHFHPRERERLRGAARAGLGCRPRDMVFLSLGPGAAAARAAVEAAGNPAFWLSVPEDERADLRPRYAAADCLLLPARDDAFDERVLEALAMGLPAIVNAQSGAAEVIEPGANGWLSEADDAAGLARLLAKADEAARGAGMGAAARASAERYGADAMARELAALYARLGSERGPA